MLKIASILGNIGKENKLAAIKHYTSGACKDNEAESRVIHM